jgi:hypothetical protein
MAIQCAEAQTSTLAKFAPPHTAAQEWDSQQWIKFGSHARQPGNRHGVQSNIEHIDWASRSSS